MHEQTNVSSMQSRSLNVVAKKSDTFGKMFIKKFNKLGVFYILNKSAH